MTKILVIEDEESIREAIVDLLEIENYQVFNAADGEEGVELAVKKLPDLVICDVMMPRLDGYGVLAKLQDNASTNTIPFIFLTAKATKSDQRQGMTLGADDYICKPFTGEELLDAVNTRLKKQTSIQQHYQGQIEAVEKKANYLLHHDPITGLPNQLSLREKFNQILSKVNQQNLNKIAEAESFSPNEKPYKNQDKLLIPLFYINLDRFQRIRNNFSYELADSLIKAAAQRIKSSLNGKGVIAHLNDDEFAIILAPIKYKQTAINVAENILKTFTEPFYLNEREISISISIGIGFYPRDGSTLTQLLQNAKKALNYSIEAGGNQSQCYTAVLHNKIDTNETIKMETDLRHALEREEFEIYYQPQISLKTGKIVGAEALLRWHHSSQGLISPNRFIELAEEIGLIKHISTWVLKKASEQVKKWQLMGFENLRIAVNLSGCQFNQLNIHQWLVHILLDTKLDAKYLGLELNEDILVENPVITTRKLNALKALGVQIAIDDFGNGYSSLNYLQQLPLDILKIHQSFIHKIHQNEKNAAITKALIYMAHQLGLKVIAEGVETSDELAFLAENHCDEIQGYLFSRPVSASQFENLLKSDKRIIVCSEEEEKMNKQSLEEEQAIMPLNEY